MQHYYTEKTSPRKSYSDLNFRLTITSNLQARESGRVLKFRYEGELHRAFVFSCVYDYLEEQGNYILCYDIGLNIICRYQISEIRALHLLDKKYKPSDRLTELCRNYHEDGAWLNDNVWDVGGDE